MIATLSASSCIANALGMCCVNRGENTTSARVKRAVREVPLLDYSILPYNGFILVFPRRLKAMSSPTPIPFFNRFHLLSVLKVVLILALEAGTVYLFMTEEDLFRNPQLIKTEV